MSTLQEESGCDEEEEEGREEDDEFDSDESLVDSDSDSDEKGALLCSLTLHTKKSPQRHIVSRCIFTLSFMLFHCML